MMGKIKHLSRAPVQDRFIRVRVAVIRQPETCRDDLDEDPQYQLKL